MERSIEKLDLKEADFHLDILRKMIEASNKGEEKVHITKAKAALETLREHMEDIKSLNEGTSESKDADTSQIKSSASVVNDVKDKDLKDDTSKSKDATPSQIKSRFSVVNDVKDKNLETADSTDYEDSESSDDECWGIVPYKNVVELPLPSNEDYEDAFSEMSFQSEPDEPESEYTRKGHSRQKKKSTGNFNDAFTQIQQDMRKAAFFGAYMGTVHTNYRLEDKIHRMQKQLWYFEEAVDRILERNDEKEKKTQYQGDNMATGREVVIYNDKSGLAGIRNYVLKLKQQLELP